MHLTFDLRPPFSAGLPSLLRARYLESIDRVLTPVNAPETVAFICLDITALSLPFFLLAKAQGDGVLLLAFAGD